MFKLSGFCPIIKLFISSLHSLKTAIDLLRFILNFFNFEFSINSFECKKVTKDLKNYNLNLRWIILLNYMKLNWINLGYLLFGFGDENVSKIYF